MRRLARTLGALDRTLLVVGTVIGSGIGRRSMKGWSRTLAATFVVLLAAASGRPADVAARPDYAAIAERLSSLINEQLADKKLPAVSIALVDDQEIVWAQGFGYADFDVKRPATADTVYRVGSVSKLFTDIGMMRLAERGQIDIDAPVTRYLPDFRPKNPFADAKPITLRMLTSHRAGLI